MRVKVATHAMKKAKKGADNQDKWRNKKELIANTRRVINIADLGNKSYLGRKWFKIPEIPGNEKLAILN